MAIPFLQPVWLWAATAVVVPVIIHLWNVRQGKTLKVGSIALLTESARSHSKSLRLSELLLLILRCLLLILLAMLLAKPVWQQFSKNEKGWILMEPQHLQATYKQYKPVIDSLTAAGFGFHYFTSDFASASLEQALKSPVGTSQGYSKSYWRLLKQLEQKVSPSFPVFLFTQNQLSRLSGTRPQVALNLQWQTYASQDTTATWIQHAYKTATDSIRLVIGNSKPDGNFYSYKTVSPANAGNEYSFLQINGKPSVRLTADTAKNAAVAVDTAALVITIYTDKFTADAAYLKAALEAIKDFTSRNIIIETTSSVQQISPQSNWLFWLSTQPVPNIEERASIFAYANGATQNIRSGITGAKLSNGNDEELIPITRLVNSSSQQNKPGMQTIWQDGFGRPVLTLSPGISPVYYFNSRFSPQWNNLTWSGQFPQMLMDVLFATNQQDGISAHDIRLVGTEQLLPARDLQSNVSATNEQLTKTDLTRVLWVIAFVVFLVERLVSFKTKKGATL